MAECPTCNGTGQVSAHIANALNGEAGLSHQGQTCHCDGPPHGWQPGWCPKTGPVTG